MTFQARTGDSVEVEAICMLMLPPHPKAVGQAPHLPCPEHPSS